MDFHEQIYFDGSDSFATVYHLTMRGTNFEIGQKLTELAIERYGVSSAKREAEPIYSQARRTYLQRNHPIFWERMRGVASVLDLDPNDNGYDFSVLGRRLAGPLPRIGCSVVYYPPTTMANGSGYLSRNYDFSAGTMADVVPMPVPPEIKKQMPRVMSELYIMEWHPEDGGYASLAIHGFDMLSGTLDGINSAGLVVSIMEDGQANEELGSNLEAHVGRQNAIGLHELQLMRYLLDTCATVDEAKQALLISKQYYAFIPCHYIVADQNGNSFVYENSTWRNRQHIIDGTGQPQAVTNFQLHRNLTSDNVPDDTQIAKDGVCLRYQTLIERIAKHEGFFTPSDLKAHSASVNVFNMAMKQKMETGEDIPSPEHSRTLWHSLYEQQAKTAEFSFYLGEEVHTDGTHTEHRSDYLKFALEK